PGGQNINKVATAVQLRFDVNGALLPADVKDRLTALAGTRMTTEGVLVIDSPEHRTQAQNRQAARARLVAWIRPAAGRRRKRQPTKPSVAVRKQRLEAKKQRGEVKRLRRRIVSE